MDSSTTSCEPPSSHICNECGDHFESRNKLFKHIRIGHQGENQHIANSVPSSETATRFLVSGNRRNSRPGRVARRRNKEERLRNIGDPPLLVSLDDFSRRSDQLTLEDAQAVTNQLGFVPTNLIEVGSRNSSTQQPETVLLYGLNKNEAVKGRYAEGEAKPFPTYIWLSCPLLKARVSKLEDNGLVGEFYKKLLKGSAGNRLSDGVSDYIRQMEEAHRLYAEERWRRLTPSDVEIVEKNNWVSSLRDVGVAGMRSADAVKCLHCHYAHFLARPQHKNIIGDWTHHALLTYEFDLKNSTDEQDGVNKLKKQRVCSEK